MGVCDVIELKHCPFCGGEAHMHNASEFLGYAAFRVICKNSCCMQSGFAESAKEAAENWNNRVPNTDTPCGAWKVFWSNFKKEGKR